MDEQRVAVVTGAGRQSSIGAAIARCLAADGLKVIAADLVWTAEEGDSGVWPDSPSIDAVSCDITDQESVRSLFCHAEDRHGRIDVVINSARAPLSGDINEIVDVGLPDWEKVISVNLTGAMLVTKHAIPLLRRSGDARRIINVSSIHGMRGVRGLAAYSASKFALNGLTQSLALELAADRITVNAVCPGIIDSGRRSAPEDAKAASLGLTRAEYQRQFLSEQSRRIPLGRIGTVDDVAALVAYVASPAAQYLTGAIIPIDGGLGLTVA